MAVRNLQAIQRQGRAVADERKNARDLKHENFWARVNKITDTRSDAIDCIDTINALIKNGLRGKFEEWMKGKSVHHYGEYLCINCSCGREESAQIKYFPKENYLKFSWSGYGMCASYVTNSQSQAEYLVDYEMKKEGKGFDAGLTKFAACLQPFLDEFFSWVESL